MLKNFHRVDVLRKYFNTKFYNIALTLHVRYYYSVIGFCVAHARSARRTYMGNLEQEWECMERVTAMEEFFERKCCILGYHESPKMLPINTLWLWKKNLCLKRCCGYMCSLFLCYRKYFAWLIFVPLCNSENFSTTEISWFTVVHSSASILLQDEHCL